MFTANNLITGTFSSIGVIISMILFVLWYVDTFIEEDM